MTCAHSGPNGARSEPLPPHDIEAEEAIIASLLVDPEAIANVGPVLEAGDFFREKNAWAFEACLALWGRAESINQITVAHELSRLKRLEEVGGIAYLSQLVTELPTSVGVEHFAGIVREAKVRRALISAGAQIVRLAYEPQNTVIDVLARAEAAVQAARREDTPGLALGAERLDELLNYDDEPLDAILTDGGDGAILTSDGKGCIAGPTGCGKTNMLLRLSRAICAGEPFLDYPVPRPRRVLYLLLEGSRRAIKRRLRKIWQDAPPEARARFHIAHMALDLTNSESLAALYALLGDVQPDVLVVDPLRNAHPADENDSAQMARVTGILDGIIARYDCAILLAHHDRKRPPFVRRDAGVDRLRGSTAFTGWLSFALSLDLDPGGEDRLILEWAKTRDAETSLERTFLDFDRDTINFHVAARTPESDASDDAILTALFHAGGTMRGPDLVRAFVEGGGISERRLRGRIRRLVKNGRLAEAVAPGDERTRARSYSLPVDQPEQEELPL